MQTANTLTVKVPYPMRHLLPEIKARGGRFDADAKTWSVPDTEDNRALADQLATPPPKPPATPEERIQIVAKTAVDLLNGLKVGTFTLGEASRTRVVITGAITTT